MIEQHPMAGILFWGIGGLIGWAFLSQFLAHLFNALTGYVDKDPEKRSTIYLWLFFFFAPFLCLIIFPYGIAKFIRLLRRGLGVNISAEPDPDEFLP